MRCLWNGRDLEGFFSKGGEHPARRIKSQWVGAYALRAREVVQELPVHVLARLEVVGILAEL